MSEVGILVLLYGVGLALLIAEIFIPSHGVLTLAGLGLLVAAVVKTFSYGGEMAGGLAILVCMIALPTFAYLCIKYWPHTPIGRRIAPPNPVRVAGDQAVPVDELSVFIGQTGRTLSPLRPIGKAEFNGRRIPCVSEMDVIEAGVLVEGTGIRSGNLAVRIKNV